MGTAWRGIEEEWTDEEKAAHILALGFGYGSCWTRDYAFAKPTIWRAGDAGDESTPAATKGFHVLRETETLELASRAVHPDRRKQPDWVRKLPSAEQAKVCKWSKEHPLNGDGAQRVREFEHWKTVAKQVCVPRASSGADVSAALTMARLPGPLRPLLLLYALQDERQAEAVLRYACAYGTRPEIVKDALVRFLFPARVPTGDAKPSARMRASEYRKQLREASARLERWLHAAAAEFLRAYSVRMSLGTSSHLGDGVTGREISAATRSPPRAGPRSARQPFRPGVCAGQREHHECNA